MNIQTLPSDIQQSITGYLSPEERVVYSWTGRDAYSKEQEYRRDMLARYLAETAPHLASPQASALRAIDLCALEPFGCGLLPNENLYRVADQIVQILQRVPKTALRRLPAPPAFMPFLINTALAMQDLERGKGINNLLSWDSVYLAERDLSGCAYRAVCNQEAWGTALRAARGGLPEARWIDSLVRSLCNAGEHAKVYSLVFKFPASRLDVEGFEMLLLPTLLKKEIEGRIEAKDFVGARALLPRLDYTSGQRRLSEQLSLAITKAQIQPLVDRGQFNEARAIISQQYPSPHYKIDTRRACEGIVASAAIQHHLPDSLRDEGAETQRLQLREARKVLSDYDKALRHQNAHRDVLQRIGRESFRIEGFVGALNWANSTGDLSFQWQVRALKIIECFERGNMVQVRSHLTETCLSIDNKLEIVVQELIASGKAATARDFVNSLTGEEFLLQPKWNRICRYAVIPLLDEGKFEEAKNWVRATLPLEQDQEYLLRYINYVESRES